jgi:hypothetical protein
MAAAVRLETDDFAVEHRVDRADPMRDLLTEHVPLREHVTAAGDEPAPMALDDREGAEAVVLRLEQPIRMIERLGDADERHRAVEHRP